KKGLQMSFSKSDVKSYDNTTVECNKNLITSFYIDSNEEFQTFISKNLYIDSNEEFQKLLMYLSKSVVASDDDITAEYNKNL
ncbi:11803_t:CDS:2, partial [Dentiscutata heterogama]